MRGGDLPPGNIVQPCPGALDDSEPGAGNEIAVGGADYLRAFGPTYEFTFDEYMRVCECECSEEEKRTHDITIP